MDSGDILVVHQNRVIFSSGKGLLSQHSKISATVTQVLTLFSQKIMGGERIHFIRFANHRMIFLFPKRRRTDDIVAIVLIPIAKNARQVVPTMGIVLNLIEQFLEGNVLDAQNRHLDTFYQLLTSPAESIYVIPRTPDGMLSALVLLTAFAHDLRYGVESVVSRLVFIDPTDTSDLLSIIEASKTSRVLSFTPIPGVEENDNILIFGLESPLKQYFSANAGEHVYDVLSRIFGENSNTAKMRKFIDNNDAREIAQSMSLFPPSEDNYLRNNVLLSTVIQPGKDIVVTMSSPVMYKMRELTPQTRVVEKTELPELQELVVGKNELKSPTLSVSAPTVEKAASSPNIQLAAEPDAIPTIQPEIKPITTSSIIPQVLSPEIASQLQKTRESGLQYNFADIPVVLDTSPMTLDLLPADVVPSSESNISISLFRKLDQFACHISTYGPRLESIAESLQDIAAKLEGRIEIHQNSVSLEVAHEQDKTALRAVLWLSIVEYLTQVDLNIKTLSSRFNIPKEGAILIIPPNREFVREKIPSKFKTFIFEKEIRDKIETEALWTLGKALDAILSMIMQPLYQGEGVAFVASEFNQEMEEIALFLLLISETCGIGFSRW
ncbi:MAG: hypothetical protein ACW98F_09110 [Candidatus Hodarchaeales archaeon]